MIFQGDFSKYHLYQQTLLKLLSLTNGSSKLSLSVLRAILCLAQIRAASITCIRSNVNEVIRAVLNSLFFFYKKISQAPKARKARKAKETQISK